MDELFKPLESIQQVNAPYFLRDKINARIAATVGENVSVKAASFAFAALTVLCLLTFYTSQTAVDAASNNTGIDLMPNNNIYGQP
ncbi:MAG: hypothetical protein CFE23_06295 [Flavobacterium sp. BFFFF1]|nr:MAG: hypothetical protein CFE23_06295 [Flavobacterium sp. BFFFF1]